ncbi:MAG: DUF1345 domain-containing protein [Actinomycetia bacterium]|nr:DUF1345 domain-containing protein [Actinomycetes bacterium]
MTKNVVDSLPSERRRVIVGAVVVLLVAVAVVQAAPWQLAIVAGWVAGASVVLLRTWIPILALDAQATQLLSIREDDSRTATRGLLVASATASLIGVMCALLEASRTPTRTMEILLTTGSVLTIIVSWLTIQTVFALRYAHRYYLAPVGGITFPGDDAPNYHDFAYISLTVGMTFQVSDTEITSPTIRRIVLQQALLAYVFGAVIIAVAINLIAGLMT